MDDSGGIPPPVNRLQDSSLRLKWRLFKKIGTFWGFRFSIIKHLWESNKKITGI